MARSEHHNFKLCALLVVFDSSKDASRRPLYWRYTGDSEQCYNSMLFSCKLKWNYSIICNGGLRTCFRNHEFNSFSRMEMCEAIYFV